MDLFGSKAKGLAASAAAIAEELERERKATFVANQMARSAEERLTALRQELERANRALADFRQRQSDEIELPRHLSTAMHRYILFLGIALLVASALTAARMLAGELEVERFGVAWGLYLGCQFDGLAMMGFGRPDALRASACAGALMTTWTVGISLAMATAFLPVTLVSIALSLVNAPGVLLLLFLGRRTGRLRSKVD